MDFSSISNFEQQILFDVRCIWIDNNVDIECYISGFELIKIKKKDIKKISKLINHFENIQIHSQKKKP